MKKAELDLVIKSRKLPKDDLDSFKDNFWGFIPVGTLLSGSIIALTTHQTETSISTSHKLIFLFSSIVLFLYTVIIKLKEKRLKSIQTNLSARINSDIVKKISEEENWIRITNNMGYYIFYIPSTLGHKGHKLFVICIDKEILFNIRNRGSVKGRMPYMFGVDSYKERVFICKIKDSISKF